jgi:16S rRNA (uracil1498-N3)-methyltransferase
MRINCLVEELHGTEPERILSEQASHHLARVLRVQAGDHITLFDGKGNLALAEVSLPSKKALQVNVLEYKQLAKPKAKITLYQALPKPDRWEWVLQKAVELGVYALQPMETAHTESVISPKKERRWQQIIQHAGEQSQAYWMPSLRPVQPISEVYAQISRHDLVCIGSLYGGTKKIKDLSFGDVHDVGLIIGPEGDFTTSEVERAVEAGAHPVSFGSQVLRTETAAIFGLSILKHELS